MTSWRISRWAVPVAVLALLLSSAPAMAAGFGIFEQGAKAMGMAGAFTAQADDPSALFHNVAGIAFQRKRDFSIGTTLINLGNSKFRGANPTPGASVRGEQASNLVTPSHIYYVQPIGNSLTFGFGFNDPFGLVTEWDKPGTWAGRYLSTRAELKTYDLLPSIAWQATPTFSVGLSAVARFSEVTLERRIPGRNPFTQIVSDVGKVKLDSDLDSGYGYNLGILHRYNNSFSWGFTYRSKVKIDYKGDARLTQILTGDPRFDPLVAASTPFNRDLPIKTKIEFPDMASLGVAIALSPSMGLEVDANWTGWSSFDKVDITFTSISALSSSIPQNWDDAYNYRLGYRWDLSPTGQLRLGYVYDESPQPDESVGPLLPDANRNGLTIGYGYKGSSFALDAALMYLKFDDRTTTTNRDHFNGTYKTSAYLFGLTASF
ncbi:MAG TPA: outer membrane protein transport protein [Thermoanaerobaculia bacterium]|nr:outer membrane protein transport protein [Thermoanaerobaculia bacterium]